MNDIKIGDRVVRILWGNVEWAGTVIAKTKDFYQIEKDGLFAGSEWLAKGQVQRIETCHD